MARSLQGALALLISVCLPQRAAAEPVRAELDSSTFAVALTGERAGGFARPNRVALSFGGAIGWVGFNRFHPGVEAHRANIESLNPALSVAELPASELIGSWLLGVRYYTPVRFFAQVDLGLLYNRASTGLGFGGGLKGQLANVNLLGEASVLVGYYRILGERSVVYAGIGPTLVFLARSYWHYDKARVSDLFAPHGGGFHALVGGEWLLSAQLALAFELRYRYVGTAPLEVVGPKLPPLPPVRELGVSSLAPTLVLRWFVWDGPA